MALSPRAKAKFKTLFTGDPSFDEVLQLLNRLSDLDDKFKFISANGRIESTQAIRVTLSSNVYVNIAVTGIEIVSSGATDRRIRLIPSADGIAIMDGSNYFAIDPNGFLAQDTGEGINFNKQKIIDARNWVQDGNLISNDDTWENHGLQSNGRAYLNGTDNSVNIELPRLADGIQGYVAEVVAVDTTNPCTITANGVDTMNGTAGTITMTVGLVYRAIVNYDATDWVVTELPLATVV